MKKLFAIFAIVALALVGCDKDSDGTGGDVSAVNGQWHITEWNGESPEFDVYINFDSGKFEIYQQVWSLDYKLFKGTYKVSGEIITGTYEDGSLWASGYKFAVNDGKLTMYSQEDQSITSVYEKCTIPDEVIAEATTATRSSEVVPFL
ncbi:MAG: lipocalin family protein [Alistipes sp.]|nr:lipocalin family protein [Alistipes sp.]